MSGTPIVVPVRDKNPTILLAGSFRHRVGHVPEGSEGRKVNFGALIPGPWAYAFSLCTVIDTRGGTAAEMTAARAAGNVLEVSDGDLISVAGHRYRIEFNRRGEWLELVAA
jgi:hypothetical protein